MTEQLKTLKDIDLISPLKGYKNLRAEAIKWIQPDTDCPIAITVNNWIKHFFNISEDDLVIDKFVNTKYELRKLK